MLELEPHGTRHTLRGVPLDKFKSFQLYCSGWTKTVRPSGPKDVPGVRWISEAPVLTKPSFEVLAYFVFLGL